MVEAEWLDYFTQQKARTDDFKSQIAQIDSKIDAMVNELYGLGIGRSADCGGK